MRRVSRVTAVLFSILLLMLFVETTAAQTRYRGPNGQGIYTNEIAPTTWTAADYAWQTDLPGYGHSSPVLWKNTLFVTAADAQKYIFHLLALEATSGKILWQKNYPFAAYKIHQEGSYATPTPVVDAELVYAIYASPEKTTVVALRHNGELAWQRHLSGIVTRHGYGASPVLVDDKLIITLEQESVVDSPFKSTWVALDKQSGAVAWEIERTTHEENSFSTPCLTTISGKTGLVFTSSDGFTFVNPANGQILWNVDPFDARAIASPVLAGDLIIGSCKGELVAIKLNGLQAPIVAYDLESKYSPYCPTPIFKDGLLYNFMDNGYVSCHRAESGEMLWRDQPAGDFFGAPVCIDGKLYAITTDGQVVVLQAGDSYKLLAINPLPEGSHATPVVANGKLFLRTFTKLICVGK